MMILFAILSILLYAVAMGMIISRWHDNRAIHPKRMMAVALIAIAFHAAVLAKLIWDVQGHNFSLFNVFSLTGLITCLLMTVTIQRTRLFLLLPILYGFACLHILATIFFPDPFLLEFDGGLGLMIHIITALFSYSTLLIGALFSLQLAYLNRQLKQKKALSINPNLPPLMMIQRQSFSIIAIGAALLLLALVLAIFVTDNLFSSGNIHNTVFSSLSLLCYGVLLWGHYAQGWRGKRTLWLSLAGLTLLTLGYFGSRIVRELILN